MSQTRPSLTPESGDYKQIFLQTAESSSLKGRLAVLYTLSVVAAGRPKLTGKNNILNDLFVSVLPFLDTTN